MLSMNSLASSEINMFFGHLNFCIFSNKFLLSSMNYFPTNNYKVLRPNIQISSSNELFSQDYISLPYDSKEFKLPFVDKEEKLFDYFTPKSIF